MRLKLSDAMWTIILRTECRKFIIVIIVIIVIVIIIIITNIITIKGFLSTEDANAQGNYALLDLTAALYWIRGNIRGFNGNKDSVTLVGAKYGAALVNILMLSPVTRGMQNE